MHRVRRASLLLALCVPLLAVVTAGGSVVIDRPAAESTGGAQHKPTGTMTIPLGNSGGYPTVEVTLNGKGPYRFAIDVNSTIGAIASDLAAELTLTPLAAETGTVMDHATVRIDALRVGELSLESVPLETADPAQYGDGPDRARGVLALSMFSEFLTTIDYANGSLQLERGGLPETNGRGIVTYRVDADGNILVPLDVDGIMVDAVVDPGLPGSVVLNRKYVAQLALPGEPKVIGRTMTPEGTFPLLSARFDGPILLGNQPIGRNSILFMDLVDAGGIGYDVLAEYAVSFDQQARRIRFSKDATRATRAQQAAAAIPSLAAGGLPLKSAFNRHADKVRLLFILSPT